jgi:hypothetical protein
MLGLGGVEQASGLAALIRQYAEWVVQVDDNIVQAKLLVAHYASQQ